MSYKPIDEIPKSEKALHGRKYQTIGGKRVQKYAYSPFTAKARKRYTFYVDVKMRKPISSPTGKGGAPRDVQWVTIPATVGTYLEFRDELLSGQTMQRVHEIVFNMGGEGIEEWGFWRNRGEKENEVQ